MVQNPISLVFLLNQKNTPVVVKFHLDTTKSLQSNSYESKFDVKPCSISDFLIQKSTLAAVIFCPHTITNYDLESISIFLV